MKIFDRRAETMSRDELELFQHERLQALVCRLRRSVRRYRERLARCEVQSLSDLAGLPVTEPDELAARLPYGMFALPLREVIRLHSAVGHEGRPVVIGHTRNDLVHWGRLVARQLVAAGVTANDVIQIFFGRGLIENALGYMLGAETIEASVIPEDPSHVEYQLAMLKDYRATVLVTSPTNARALARALDERRVDPQSLFLRTVILSRPVSREERREFAAGLFAEVRCNFGVGEILDPGLCVECDQHRFHVNEDQFLVETKDGELLVTTLCREAMPLLRYATRVACELRQDRCPCGRTGTIVEPGERLDGRLRVAETALYRAQIEKVLVQTRASGHPFELELRPDRIVVSIRVTKNLFADRIRDLEDIREEIRLEFRTRLGIEADVRYLTPRAV